jgi:hypothetical protein
MYSYLIIFFIIYLFSFAENKYNKKNLQPYVIISLFLLFTFVSIRYQTGGDWKEYENTFNNYRLSFFNLENFLERNFLFYLITWYFSNFFNYLIFQNIFLSLIFFIFFFIFLKKNIKYKITSLLIIFPIGVLLLVMGYQKQALALSFLFLIITAFNYSHKSFFVIFFILGVLSHYTLLIFTPLLIFLTPKYLFTKFNENIQKILSKSKTKFLLTLFILFLILLNLIYFNKPIINILFIFSFLSQIALFENFQYYSSELIQSNGSLVRILLASISLFISIIYYEKIIYKNVENSLFLFFILFFILLFILNIFMLTTIADRLAFYTIPFQIIVISRFINVFKKKYQLIKHFVILPYIVYLLVWLKFSIFSLDDWQPYLTIFDFR